MIAQQVPDWKSRLAAAKAAVESAFAELDRWVLIETAWDEQGPAPAIWASYRCCDEGPAAEQIFYPPQDGWGWAEGMANMARGIGRGEEGHLTLLNEGAGGGPCPECASRWEGRG